MPVAFRDEVEQEAFFAILRSDIMKDADAEMAKALRDCQNQARPNNNRIDPRQCEEDRAKIEASRDQRIKDFDLKLKGTRIDPIAPPIQRT